MIRFVGILLLFHFWKNLVPDNQGTRADTRLTVRALIIRSQRIYFWIYFFDFFNFFCRFVFHTLHQPPSSFVLPPSPFLQIMAGSKKNWRTVLLQQLKNYLRQNWINLLVLGFVLSLSFASSFIIYEFAGDSVSFLFLCHLLSNGIRIKIKNKK